MHAWTCYTIVGQLQPRALYYGCEDDHAGGTCDGYFAHLCTFGGYILKDVDVPLRAELK
jgi:hypothetical protein